MKKSFFAIVLVSLCALSLAQDSMEPPGYGVYYKTKGGWQKIEYTSPLGNNVGVFSGVTLTYHGAAAALQIADHRPVFYFERMTTARNTIIVRLEKKKDQRDVKVIRTGVLTAKGGPDKKHVPDVTVQSVNDRVISITPTQELPSGEYLLTDSGGYGGYDFGIQ